MKLFLTTALTALTLSAPAFAETTAAELFAMSNDSAAETIVQEHSTGDVTAAQITLALDNMSAAEREVFLASPHEVRMETLKNCLEKTDSGDSAAESCVINKK
ncbi:hypothetical protein SAMN05444273_10654 [Litoreibacter ascidiaceicola]|uniref:UrcA family protein n=1 Tax=Litoreibacter ascidiaceicola TaxID=1486859 RepID=A0A1M5BMJ6_9RHOB|nr:hypothetical protein [Litoreibacter ascidiaceicola]SHF43833.1 hypothetical protein SAMN05444273_10654 [Litoreibacter ascidiaceicola]